MAGQWLASLLSTTEPAQRTRAIIRKWRELTPALARASVQVSALTAAARGDAAEALGNLLTFAASQFNVGKNLNDVQIAVLAGQLLRDYWHWRFDEFALVLREAVAGRYGTTYDRVDAPTVNGWCQLYEAQRNALEADATEQQVLAWKRSQPNPSPLAADAAFGGDYGGAREQLEALSDGHLVATGRHYRQQAGAEAAFICAVALEVYQERQAARKLRELLASLPGSAQPTARELHTQQQAEDRAVEAALARGDRAAAGLPLVPAPGLYENLPEATPYHKVFPPACPKCLQRPEQCMC